MTSFFLYLVDLNLKIFVKIVERIQTQLKLLF